MRIFILLACMLSTLSVVGCGGGGTPTTTASPATQVTLSVPTGAAPAGVIPTVTTATTGDLPKLTGSAFVAAAKCTPAGTAFAQPVTLTFKLSTPLGASDSVDLFQSDSQNNWTQAPGAVVDISSDRLTVTAQVSEFSVNAYYAVLRT